MSPRPFDPAAEPESESRWLTLSNGLTSLRLISIPLFCWALAGNAPGLAFALFWLAVATDLVDGRVARARGESSRFGGLFDHATDASFVSLGLAVLALQGRTPVVLPLLVAAAFVQYVLDSRILAGEPLRASFLGRWNGILYFVPLGIVTTREVLGIAVPSDGFVLLLCWGLVISTGLSMIDRLFALRQVRRSSVADASHGS